VKQLNRRILEVLLFVFGTSQAFAAAELRNVDGNVLVSTKDGLSVASEKLRVDSGVTVSTTAKASVLVVFDVGCEVKLEPNQKLMVRGGTPCAALLASVEPVALAPVVAAAPVLGTVTGTSLLALGASTATGVYLYNRSSRNVSPN
jgi:hypothetical protein